MRAIFILPLLLLTTTAYAQFQSGNDLHSDCQATQSNFSDGFCTGYTTGVSDALKMVAMETYCLQEGVTIGQIVDVVTKQLADQPERRHYSAASQVARALTESFPC